MKLLRTGDFARKAGVTVRTLRYYDHVGLLKPSGYSESGQRLYAEADFARLQQILTLKLIGLTLEEIKGLLTTEPEGVEALLERQKRVLQAQMRQLAAVIDSIDRAQAALHTSHTLDLERLIQIIRAVNMNQHANWYEQFFTDAQRDQLATLQVGATLDAHRQVGESWKQLFEDARALMEHGADAAAVQALVTQWDALIELAAHGDTALAQQLNEAYANVAALAGSADEDSAAWAANVQRVAEFVRENR